MLKQSFKVLESKKYHRNFLIFSIIFYIILSIEYFSFIWINSVNLIYWDQWDFYNTLFSNQSYWDSYKHLHAPHRQGLGFVIDRLILENTDWNNKWESIYIGFLYLFCSIVVLVTLKNIRRKLNGFHFIVVALLFFNKNLLETCLIVPNPAHGAFPLFGILLINLYLVKKNIKD